MACVLDCSVAMAWVFPDEASEATARLRDALIDGRAFVPSLWPVEVGSVLLAATRRGRIGVDEWPGILAALAALPIEVEPVSTSRAWGPVLALADRHDLSLYKATYLELAVRMRLPLATLDLELAAAARAAGIDTPIAAPGR